MKMLKHHSLLRIFAHGCLRRFCHSSTAVQCGNSNSAEDVRVRFAPSPTGQLHLGGLRTALYNDLFAKANDGTFILRIEDTDQTRFVPGATEKLTEMLQWAGIKIDEGPQIGGSYGPYMQSERIELYWDSVQPLLQNGTAYYCFCTSRRLDLLRKEANRRGETPKYDNRCRHLSPEDVEANLKSNVPYVIRFKLESHTEPWEDMVYGKITYDVASIEGDPILLKSDRFPTYHFASVVDDHHMKISHVLRGMEWQVSTTKHLLLYKALGWKPPKFAHLPLILNKDGSKLSKRQNNIYVESFKEAGYFPDAVLNLLTTMGSGFKVRHTTGMTLMELVKNFDINNLNTNSTKLELERVVEFNRLHLDRSLEEASSRSQIISQARAIVQEHLRNRLVDNNMQDRVISDPYIGGVLDWAKDRIGVLQDIVSPDMEFLWTVPSMDAIEQLSASEKEFGKTLHIVCEALQRLPDERFTKADLTALLKNLGDEHQLKYSTCMKWLRSAISGLQKGPSVAEIITVLGKTHTVDRLQYVLDSLGIKSLDSVEKS